MLTPGDILRSLLTDVLHVPQLCTVMAWLRMGFLLGAVTSPVVRGRVEEELFPECREFLYMGTPPSGLEVQSV